MSQSNSVGWNTSARSWLADHFAFFRMRLKNLTRLAAISDASVGCADEYEELYSKYTGKSLRDATILEIGFGQRPVRLLVMSSLGYRVRGVDLDEPMLDHSFASILKIARRNGPARAAKTAVRHYLFDGAERRGLDKALRRRGKRLVIDKSIFLVGDAAEFDFPHGSIDFIYSEDVFEHIPPESFAPLSAKMAQWLAPGGIAAITPCVYASLPGSHLTEWFPGTLKDAGRQRTSSPWEHLRERRYRADCYLNELKLADYRKLLGSHLEIVDEIDMDPGVGAAYLDPSLEAELNGFERKELVGSRFRFILKRPELNS